MHGRCPQVTAFIPSLTMSKTGILCRATDYILFPPPLLQARRKVSTAVQNWLGLVAVNLEGSKGMHCLGNYAREWGWKWQCVQLDLGSTDWQRCPTVKLLRTQGREYELVLVSWPFNS